MKKKWIIAILVFGGVLIAAGVAVPLLASPSNCGRNSSALTHCGMCILQFQVAAEGKDVFNLSQLNQQGRDFIVSAASNHWNQPSTLLIKTNFNFTRVPKEIVVVCDTPYSNVPQPTIWNGYRENPAHAVGYSDGSRGLISLQEFKALNLAGFIDARELSPIPAGHAGVAAEKTKSL